MILILFLFSERVFLLLLLKHFNSDLWNEISWTSNCICMCVDNNWFKAACVANTKHFSFLKKKNITFFVINEKHKAIIFIGDDSTQCDTPQETKYKSFLYKWIWSIESTKKCEFLLRFLLCCCHKNCQAYEYGFSSRFKYIVYECFFFHA